MSISNFRSEIFIVLIQALISGCLSQSYSDLEALGINCPSKDKCEGYRNNLTYMDRSCECDDKCTAYEDCCIDALPSSSSTPQASRPAARTDITCLHYGEQDRAGVYVVSKCSDSWNGPKEVREKCLGSDDLSDPLSSVPVTDVAQKETYRNLACAECNNVNLSALKPFRLKMQCHGVENVEEESIIADLTYNEERQLWGVNRLNRFGNGTEFFGCKIIFDVPEYLNDSVRYCRFDFISKCASNWKRPTIAKLCSQYMTVVYSNTDGYRNPHCAICNHKTVDEISCRDELLSRRRQPTFPIIIDFIEGDDGIEVGKTKASTPACPSEQIYDSVFKRCRRLACALPGYSLVNGKCAKG